MPIVAFLLCFSFAFAPLRPDANRPPKGLPLVAPNPIKIVGQSKKTILSVLNEPKPYTNFQDFFHDYAPRFEGVKYGAGGTGLQKHQTLINVEEMDCVTFVENVIALALAKRDIDAKNIPANNEIRFNLYIEKLNLIRYYEGVNCGAQEDRIHYFTAALLEFEKKGYAFNLCRFAGGQTFDKKINYISSNPKKYGFDNWKRVKAQEAALSAAKRYYFPIDELYKYEEIAQPGDIIALTTDVVGLDVSHCGLMDVEDGELKFTHSTLVSKKVLIRELFCFYMSRRTTITGLMVYRPTF